jgi:hypothetical protein
MFNSVAIHQSRVHFFYVLGDQAKHDRAVGFNLLIMEGNRFEGQDSFVPAELGET